MASELGAPLQVDEHLFVTNGPVAVFVDSIEEVRALLVADVEAEAEERVVELLRRDGRVAVRVELCEHLRHAAEARGVQEVLPQALEH